MKTVSANFLYSQKSASPTGVRHIYYKRRYWNGSAFVWEANWTELARTKICNTSPITWQLDTDQLNEFKVSNVTITVDNSDNSWRPDNPKGFFAKDSGSPTYGYEPYWTKFQVRAGYLLSDGVTEETLTLFTGLLVDYNMDSGSEKNQLLIQGLEIMLVNTKAESIGTTVTNELVGTGNGSNKVFTTANPGVGDITAVRVNGVTQVLGVDYTISQTNVPASGAQISFTVAPANTFPVRADYYYWPQNKQFSDIVTLLLTAAGVPSGNQNVQATLFSNSVINTFSYQTATDFNTGTLSQLLDTEHTDMLEIDWQNASNYTTTNWSTTTSGWTITNSGSTAGTTSDGTYLIMTTGSSGTGADGTRVTRSSSPGIGTWEFKFTKQTAGAHLPGVQISIGAGTWSTGFPSGLLLIIGNGGTNGFNLYEDVGGSGFATWSGYTPDTSEHTVRITFNGTSVLVYFDSTLVITYVTKLTTAQFTSIGFSMGQNTDIHVAQTVKIRSIVTPVATATGTWTSPIIDLTTTPSAWGGMTIVDDNGGASGSIVYATDVSSNNFSTSDGFTNVSGGNVPLSTLRRYVKIRASFSYPTNTWPRSATQGDPYVDGISFVATTSSTAVILPNFAGQTAYDAIQAIGEYTNYEFGFKPDETFFFRQRPSGSSVMTLTQSDYLSKVSGLDSGYTRVYGIVRATYGAYVRETTDAGNTPTSPVARVSQRRYDISPDSNIQVAASADIATGVSAALFAYMSKPKRRFKAITKFLPQIELSDFVTATLINNEPYKSWFWGDNQVWWGRSDIYWWSENGTELLNAMPCKIIGARFDIDKFNCELTLEEVVS